MGQPHRAVREDRGEAARPHLRVAGPGPLPVAGAVREGRHHGREEAHRPDHRDIRRYTSLLRALGLVTGKVDLLGATNEANGAGTLAYYSFEDKQITIRGQRLTPAVRSTLVHELTHALQDQHFRDRRPDSRALGGAAR